MIRSDDLPAGFEFLVDKYVDDIISNEELADLERILLENVAARHYFRQHCQLRINLDADARAQRALASLPDGGQPAASAVAPPPTPRRNEFLDRGKALLLHVFNPRRPMLAACVVMAVAIGAGLIWHTLPGRSHSPGPQVAGDATPPPRITNVRFDTTETRTLALADFGQMHIQGPADLDLIGDTRARLRRGRIRVRIDHERCKGFVVETPRGEVTDRGTEFGIDVGHGADTGVVVFQGNVDLAVPQQSDHSLTHIHRLEQGDGVVVKNTGELGRMMAIVTGSGETFRQRGEPIEGDPGPIITDVWDDVQVSECKKLYEIVPGGLGEDALAYADRTEHEWNGVDERGIPSYLLGADYVKTYNDYKVSRTVQIHVTVRRPARLFVFFDSRLKTPDWLATHFHNTGDVIGVDEPYNYGHAERAPLRGTGPGVSVDARYCIWERIIERPRVVTLGPNAASSRQSAMYGIAAVALEEPHP